MQPFVEHVVAELGRVRLLDGIEQSLIHLGSARDTEQSTRNADRATDTRVDTVIHHDCINASREKPGAKFDPQAGEGDAPPGPGCLTSLGQRINQQQQDGRNQRHASQVQPPGLR